MARPTSPVLAQPGQPETLGIARSEPERSTSRTAPSSTAASRSPAASSSSAAMRRFQEPIDQEHQRQLHQQHSVYAGDRLHIGRRQQLPGPEWRPGHHRRHRHRNQRLVCRHAHRRIDQSPSRRHRDGTGSTLTTPTSPCRLRDRIQCDRHRQRWRHDEHRLHGYRRRHKVHRRRTIKGTGSVWNLSDTADVAVGLSQGLTVGQTGAGTLTLAQGGTLNVLSTGSTVLLGGAGGSSGTLNIGAASASPAVAPGTLNASTVTFATGVTSTVNFNHTSSNYVFSPQLTGTGAGSVTSSQARRSLPPTTPIRPQQSPQTFPQALRHSSATAAQPARSPTASPTTAPLPSTGPTA